MNQDKIALCEKASKELREHESACRLCPRECGVNRKKENTGFCRSGSRAVISHVLLHHGEEPVLSGEAGSGTIFFSGCSLKCRFCQNYQLSWENRGRPILEAELAQHMLELQAQGALNINLVTPTHFLPAILRALSRALGRGLQLPVVYNSSGYEKAGLLRQLEGLVDIWLPDLKYRSPRLAEIYSGAPDYFEQASQAILEMYCQQPRLDLEETGTARRGIIIRHLVLPGHSDDSLQILHWIAENFSPSIGLSLMSQYHPCYLAPPELRRALPAREYRLVLEEAVRLGFQNLFVQPTSFSHTEQLIPDFEREAPFQWSDRSGDSKK